MCMDFVWNFGSSFGVAFESKFVVGEHEKWYGLRQGQHGSVATIVYRYNVDDVLVVHRHSLFIVDGY